MAILTKTGSVSLRDWRTILRPVWGFVALQPIILAWFYLFSDDWWADYTALGWPLQIVSTVWLIPAYALYENWWEQRSNL